MDPVLTIFPVMAGFISMVFLVSGATKLGALDKSVDALIDLKIPRFLCRKLTVVALSVGELILGMSLFVSQGTIFLGTIAAISILLVFFTGVLWGSVRRKDDVECACFGSLGSGTVSKKTILRNLILISATLLAGVLGNRFGSALSVIAGGSGAQWFWWLSVVPLGALLMMFGKFQKTEGGQIARTSALEIPDVPRAITGLPIPPVEVMTGVGTVRELPALVMGSAMLLVFTKAGCSSCEMAASKVSHWQRVIGDVRLRMITSSDRESLHHLDKGLLDNAFFGAKAAKEALGVDYLPAAVLFGTNGTIATELVVGAEAIEDLVNAIGSLPK